MSNFTTDDVRRLARLARLELTAAEEATFTRQLAEILEFARQINAVDTTTVVAADDLRSCPPRSDDVHPSLDRTEVLAAAPDADAPSGLIKVPRVLNG